MYRLPLVDHRVLDLTSGAAAYAGRLLGDLGAEVIKVEPPAGDPIRGSDPASFERFNANKYGCQLDIGTSGGRETFLRLVARSDVVIATDGTFNADELRSLNESLVVVLFPTDAGPVAGVSAAAAVGLALWDRRRTGRGGTVRIAAASPGLAVHAPEAPPTEPVSSNRGQLAVPRSPWPMSETPPHVRLPAPEPGEHDEWVRILTGG